MKGLLTYLREQLGFALFLCVINVSRGEDYVLIWRFFSRKITFSWLKCRSLGSLELMLLHEKSLTQGNCHFLHEGGIVANALIVSIIQVLLLVKKVQYAGTDGRWQFSCVQV